MLFLNIFYTYLQSIQLGILYCTKKSRLLPSKNLVVQLYYSEFLFGKSNNKFTNIFL